VLLRANGVSIRATNDELYEMTLAASSGGLEKHSVAATLRQFSQHT